MRYDIPKRFSDATMALVDEEQFGPVCVYAQHLKERFLKGDGLILTGAEGLGKSFAAAALTRHFRRAAKKDGDGFGSCDYVFITAPDMFDKIAIVGDCYDSYRGKEYVDTFSTTPWLVINDLGKEYRGGKFDEQIPYKLGRILRARAEREIPTFVTTNLSGADIRSIYGASITSILAETCRSYEIEGKDRRKRVA